MKRPAYGARELAGLLSVDTEAGNLWSSEDLGDILRHQLHATIVFDLAKLASGQRLDSALLSSSPVKTFRDLLLHSEPPLPLLLLTKDFAKAARLDPDRPLPAEVATVLYYASICAAKLRLDEQISSMSTRELRTGAAWVLEQHWVDRELKELFRETLARARDDGTS